MVTATTREETVHTAHMGWGSFEGGGNMGKLKTTNDPQNFCKRLKKRILLSTKSMRSKTTHRNNVKTLCSAVNSIYTKFHIDLVATVMPGFHNSVAVLPLPFRRSHYVNSVRIT